MRRVLAFLLIIAAFSFTFTACGTDKVKDIDVDAVVNEIVEKYKLIEGSLYTSSSDVLGEYLDEDLIISCYGDAAEYPDFSKVEKYCVYMDESNPKVITDVGIFKMKDTSYSDTLMKYIQARIDTKIADGVAYPDIDVETLKKAVVRQKGSYVYYAVSPDVDDIISDIEKAFGK